MGEGFGLERSDVGVAEALRSSYAGRRVTITGGASFIGSHLTELLLTAGAVVRIADDLSSGRLEHLARCRADVDVLVGDLRDPSVAATAARGSEIMFHLAARHGGRGYIDTHPVECVSNAALDNSVLSAAATASAGRVVFTSSACVYPVASADTRDDSNRPLSELEAGFTVPGTAFADGEYGWAKLYGELQLAAFAKAGAFTGVTCRLFNAYGERQNESHAVVALIDRALRRNDPFLVWGDGTQQRSFTYVRDVAVGLALAGTHEQCDVFNIGSTTETSIDDLCELVFATVGWAPGQITHDVSRPVGERSRLPDMTKMSAEFGWQPTTPLRLGLERTVAHCHDRMSPERADAGVAPT